MTSPVPPSTTAIRWSRAVRIVASIWPPVPLFDDLVDPADFDALYAAQAATNPRLATAMGALDLLAPAERVVGPGTGYVMAAFTHLAPDGGRFTPPGTAVPTFGAFYAARDQATAEAESIYHREQYLRDAGAGSQDVDVRVLVADVEGARFADVRPADGAARTAGPYAAVYAEDYRPGQSLAAAVRGTTSVPTADGVVYASVRRTGGECVAAFRPRVVRRCREAKHLLFRWDGAARRITAVLAVGSRRTVP